MRLAAVALGLLCGCARACGGGAYVVHRAPQPPRIDGVLDDAAWNRAARAGPFVRSIDGKAASAATVAYLVWDDEALYVAFQAADPDVSTHFTRDDEPLYTSNVVEIFLNPGGDLVHYVEIEVAPSNALFDASFVGRRKNMDLSWSSHARHAVHVDGTLNDSHDVDRGWTVELAIPFAALPGSPRPRRGDEWRFNLYRLRQPPGEGQAFNPPMVGDFHALDKFGVLVFGDEKAHAPAVAAPAKGEAPATKKAEAPAGDKKGEPGAKGESATKQEPAKKAPSPSENVKAATKQAFNPQQPK